MNGQLTVAQWLLEKRPNLNMSVNNEWAFRWACMNGHLTVAQWLLEKRPGLDMGAENESAFRKACTNGHLAVAQWLLEKRPGLDMGTENNSAFKFANHLTATCLADTFPWCYVIHEDGTRLVISGPERDRRFQDYTWKRRRYAMLAWKRGRLAQLPDDMAREVIGWV